MSVPVESDEEFEESLRDTYRPEGMSDEEFLEHLKRKEGWLSARKV